MRECVCVCFCVHLVTLMLPQHPSFVLALSNTTGLRSARTTFWMHTVPARLSSAPRLESLSFSPRFFAHFVTPFFKNDDLDFACVHGRPALHTHFTSFFFPNSLALFQGPLLMSVFCERPQG